MSADGDQAPRAETSVSTEDSEIQWEQPKGPETAPTEYCTVEFTHHDGSTRTWLNVTMSLPELIQSARENRGWLVGATGAINLDSLRGMRIIEVHNSKQEGFKPAQYQDLR